MIDDFIRYKRQTDRLALRQRRIKNCFCEETRKGEAKSRIAVSRMSEKDINSSKAAQNE